ncbi:MAG: glycosyltransferase family 87 protein [Candidatus Zixiibacteriota bacterium]
MPGIIVSRMPPPGASRFRKILTAVVITVAAGSLLLFYYQSVRNYFKFAEIDFTSYLRASAWFFSAENPYQEVTRRYLYPLFLLVVVYPFTLLQQGPLGKSVSISVWSLGAVATFLATMAATWKHQFNLASKRSALRANLLPAALLVLMLHPFLQDEFLNSQANLYVLGCIAAYFFFLERDRQFWATLFLAAAASIKVAPALCLLYAVVSKQFRTPVYFVVLVVAFN